MGDEAGAAGAAGATQWYAGQDAETVGYLQNRGWDKLEPKDAAFQAIKSYREAEKHIGIPPDQIVRMPKDANDKDSWDKLYSRLGVPATADKYDFSGVKFTDGTDVDADTLNAIRAVAHQNHLTPDAAANVTKQIVKMLEDAETKDTAEYNAKLDVEKGTLRTNWGSNAPQFKVIAENAAKALSVTPEEIAALEKTIGYARVMDMFRNIGQRIGEDKFVSTGGGAGNQRVIMTQQQAAASLEQKMADEDWVAKFNKGDVMTMQEFDQLTRIKAGIS